MASCWLVANRPKGDRVAGRIQGGNAVLPFVARGAAQEIDRAAVEPHGGAFPAATAPAAHPESARRNQRDAYHVAEVRPGAMPADRRRPPGFGGRNGVEAVRG